MTKSPDSFAPRKQAQRGRSRELDYVSFWSEQVVFRNPYSPVTIIRMDESPGRTHHHAFTELVFITEGSGTMVVDAKSFAIGPGSYFVIREPSSHGYTRTCNLKLVNVLIRRSFWKQYRDILLKTQGGRRLIRGAFCMPEPLNVDALGYCLRLVDRIEREGTERQEAFATMQQALALDLLVTVCRLNNPQPEFTDIRNMRICQVLAFIDGHFAEPIALSDLKGLAAMSPRSFLRHFQESVGASPKQYLQRVRLQQACQMLHGTDLPVYSVAEACGFSDSAYFCRLFRDRVGISPNAFRRSKQP